jgi:hypothetical protein
MRGIGRDEYDERLDAACIEALQQRKSISLWHVHVQEYQIRYDCCVHSLAIGDGTALANDADLLVARQKCPDAPSRNRFIIDDDG